MLRLILVRHAEAAPKPPGGSDADRPLTAAGRAAAEKTARALGGLAGSSASILCSPKDRAAKTAEIVASRLGSPSPAIFEPLGGGSEPEAILASLPPGETETLILVGHEPDMGQLLARLLDPSWQGSIPLPAAGYAVVALDDIPPRKAGRLVAFGSP